MESSPIPVYLKYSSIALWFAQFWLTFCTVVFFYRLSRQAERSGYREKTALPFAVALGIWSFSGVVYTLEAYFGNIPFLKSNLNYSKYSALLEFVSPFLSTLNTLMLTIGTTRLDNFPKRYGGKWLSKLANRSWGYIGCSMIGLEALVAISAKLLSANWDIAVTASRIVDACYGLAAVLLMTMGLYSTFRRYKMGATLTGAILITLCLLEAVLIIHVGKTYETPEQAVFITGIMVTSKVAFMIILVMLAGAWGQYYTSGTFEEINMGKMPKRVRQLYGKIPGGENLTEVRQNAFDIILSYWPDSPILMEAIQTEGPSSKEVMMALKNPQLIADLIEAGILNLSLSHVGDDITTELINESKYAMEDSDGEILSNAS